MSDIRKEPVISYHTSPYGLRMVHIHAPEARVGYCGVAVRVGSRDEEPDRYGLAHFVEHTIFKGTRRRSSWHIINRMETVGGELNAYTTKEETVVYTAFPAGNMVRAVELVSDLVLNSQFPERELEKEREVVADEIDSYLDSPAEAVYDDFEDEFFAGHPLGHNILGAKSNLSAFTPETCREYLRRWYTAPNMVAFYSGPDRAESFFRSAERHFAGLPSEVPTRESLPGIDVRTPFELRRHIDSHQAHTVAGAMLPSMYSPERYTFALLSNILGGPGMNSMLNVALRERRGLVYTVEASSTLFSDCGLLTVYYGCDPADNERCLSLVRRQMATLADKPMTDRQLQRLKKQYLGQLAVASENRESMALAATRATLFRGAVTPMSESEAALLAVTPAELCLRAGALAGACALTLGPE